MYGQRGFHVQTVGALPVRRAAAAIVAVALLLWLAPAALADPVDIQSAGPLSNIWIGDNLTCQAVHAGVQVDNEPVGDFYGGETGGPASCGTILALTTDTTGAGVYGIEGGGGDFTPVTAPTLTGSGTAQDPYVVTTSVTAGDSDVNITEKDSYVVGNEFYRTDITVINNSTDTSWSGGVYHAGDCYLDGDDDGFGVVDTSNNGVACAQNSANTPPGPLMEFAPLTGGSHYFEGDFSSAFNAPSDDQDYPDTCACAGDSNGAAIDNGEGINWDFTSLAPGQQTTFSMLSNFSESGTLVSGQHTITATGGRSFAGNAPFSLSNATVATFTDSATTTTSPSDYAATINWGDGSSSNGTVSGGNGSFTVTGSHTYGTPDNYPINVTISDVSNTGNNATAADSAAVDSAPSPVVTDTPVVKSSSAVVLTGSANPDGLPTTGHWIYGLDASQRGPGFSGNVFDQSTPSQTIGSDFSNHTISFPLSGLMPNSIYHVEFVASNSAGTTTGPDRTFTTPKLPVSNTTPPPLGKENFTPSGTVFILVNGKFVKLTQTLQLPSGTVVDAVHGSLTLVSSSAGSAPASDAKAKKGKKVKKPKTFTGTFGGAVFKVTQTTRGANKGLTTLTLMDGAYKGAPSYASCKAKGAADAHAALSSRALQTLRSRSSGRYTTRGRYAAGTVRGTAWTTTDRCDGTLIAVQQHSVDVTDLVKHKTILVKAGHHYLAKAPSPRKRK